MTTSIPETPFADPAPAQHLERAAAALTAPGFTVEILDGVAAARARVEELIPEGASVRRVEEHCLPLETARTQ